MNICIGGDLDGQVIEQEGRALKASTINPEFKTEYYKQLYIKGDEKYHCWLDTSMDLGEATEKASYLFRKKKGYIS
ncbi:hypothetical protein AWW72_14875 [Acinetobacter sp. NRRL B-65365]|uniref:hypothetical protein n=1 Tax=Acinetobacter sp. NRRL B-65365 TaxID=1785092 RepID=UPI0007A08770|nr:hypothetical protein [Acinetobacter sp. NRRL B-65365]KYQ83284.1 hypothetical protein AWW72_14875 [Acinetobacter sp. NRRL B-65365]